MNSNSHKTLKEYNFKHISSLHTYVLKNIRISEWENVEIHISEWEIETMNNNEWDKFIELVNKRVKGI